MLKERVTRLVMLGLFAAQPVMGLSQTGPSGAGASTGVKLAPREIAARAFRSVVLLVMADGNQQPLALGSGFFVKPGVIATNYHVLEGSHYGFARLVGQETKYPIRGIVGTDVENDLALVTIDGEAAPSQTAEVSPHEGTQSRFGKPLDMNVGRAPAVGEELYAVGNPRGLEGTFSSGVVSGVRDLNGHKLLQITAPISPGSSGGPVLDASGRVIGVAVASLQGGQNLNFAVPVEYLLPLMKGAHPIAALSSLAVPAAHAERRLTEAVIGHSFLWDDIPESCDHFPSLPCGFSLTLQNALDTDVKDVRAVVVFYDSQRRPVEAKDIRCDSLGAGLARRVKGSVDHSVKALSTPETPANLTEEQQRVFATLRGMDQDLIDRLLAEFLQANPQYGPQLEYMRGVLHRVEIRILDFEVEQ
jgi:hypothetical protein